MFIPQTFIHARFLHEIGFTILFSYISRFEKYNSVFYLLQ